LLKDAVRLPSFPLGEHDRHRLTVAVALLLFQLLSAFSHHHHRHHHHHQNQTVTNILAQPFGHIRPGWLDVLGERDTRCGSFQKMGTSEELEYLKSLVSQLNEKIRALEDKAKNALSLGKGQQEQQLRTILMGPPGAGEFVAFCIPLLKHVYRKRDAGSTNPGYILRVPPCYRRHAA
jgi:hypothetical protein